MGKVGNFCREIANNIIDNEALNYGVCKAVDILLDLEITDDKIKQLLVKHFDIRYSEAESVLKEAMDCRK